MCDGIQRKAVQITISEQCNLNCIYCYEKNKNPEVMRFETFRRIIERSFEDCEKEVEEIEFSFHGGEIGLFFDEIMRFCEWLWEKPWPKKYVCSACTNGTLIHGDVQVWLKRNAHRFKLGLSLDGTPEMHNINRNDSFGQIDVDFFLKTWPKQGCKMTVSPQTLPKLYEGVLYLHSLGLKVAVNLAYGIDWTTDLLKTYRQQLELLVRYFIQNPDEEEPNLLQGPLAVLGAKLLCPDGEDFKWCGTGERMVCYSPNGQAYPCQMFMPSSTGKGETEAFRKIDFCNYKLFCDERCRKCVLKGVCPTCYGQNYIMTGSVSNHPEGLCPYRKIEALASSRLTSMRLLDEQYREKYKKEELKPLIRATRYVQESLSEEVYSY